MALFRKKQDVTPDGFMRQSGYDPKMIKGSKASRSQGNEDFRFGICSNRVSNVTKRSQYLNFLIQLDLNEWCHFLEWINPPNGLTSWMINHMLYYRGALAGFMISGKFYLLPFAQSHGVNIYGLPNKVTPITYNGASAGNDPSVFRKNFDLLVNNYGDMVTDKAGAVILYAKTPHWVSSIAQPPYLTNLPLLEQLADILARVNIQIRVANKKIIIKCDDAKQKDSIIDQLTSALDSDSEFIVYTGIGLETFEIQPKNESASDLWLHFKSFTDLRNMSNGIPNGGMFIKKERVIGAEKENEEPETDINANSRLTMAKLFVEHVKKIWPDNEEISKFDVRINEAVMRKEEEVNDDSEDMKTERDI